MQRLHISSGDCFNQAVSNLIDKVRRFHISSGDCFNQAVSSLNHKVQRSHISSDCTQINTSSVLSSQQVKKLREGNQSWVSWNSISGTTRGSSRQNHCGSLSEPLKSLIPIPYQVLQMCLYIRYLKGQHPYHSTQAPAFPAIVQ